MKNVSVTNHSLTIRLIQVLLVATLAIIGTNTAHAQSSPTVRVVAVTDTVALKAEALAFPDVQKLQSFLTQQGYIAQMNDLQAAEVTFGEAHVYVTVLIPFTSDIHPRAHLAFWTNGKTSHAGTVFDGQQVYVVSADQVKEVSKAVLESATNGLLAKISLPTGEKPYAPLEVAVTNNRRPGVGETTTSAGVCKTVEAVQTGYTVLGFVAYKFHQLKDWCFDGTTVSNVAVNTYLSQVDGLQYYRGIASSLDRFDPAGQTWHNSIRQAHMENCIVSAQIGCISSTYPATQITVHADGSFEPSVWF